jgi:hypothetical protein
VAVEGREPPARLLAKPVELGLSLADLCLDGSQDPASLRLKAFDQR